MATSRSRPARRRGLPVLLAGASALLLVLAPVPAGAIVSTDQAVCDDDEYAQVTAWFRSYVGLEVDGLAIDSVGSGLRIVEVRSSTPGAVGYASAMGIATWERAATFVDCTDQTARRWAP